MTTLSLTGGARVRPPGATINQAPTARCPSQRLRTLTLALVALAIALPPAHAHATASATSGTRRIEYDFDNQPVRIVDAMGQLTTIARDLIGRPASLQFADGKVTTLRYDLKPFDRGYLSTFADRSGSTEYTRDGFGRVVTKRQSLASGFAQQLSYTFAPSGLLESVVYAEGNHGPIKGGRWCCEEGMEATE